MGPDEVSGRDRHILKGCDIERRKRECAKPQGPGYRARGEFWARPRSRIHSGFRLALAADWGQFGEVGELVKNSSLEGAFSHVISVDEVKTYKPSPATYQLAAKKMRSEPGSIRLFPLISSTLRAPKHLDSGVIG
jgi:FMN phosphatase YigB (HAD superfamily)